MRGLRVAGLGVLCALALPAPSGAATISVEGDVLRYAGDDAADSVVLGRVENGELVMTTAATPGPGCRERQYGEDGSTQVANRACSLAGVTRFDFLTGAGSDEFDAMGGFDELPVPMRIDTGSEGDRVSFASIYDDEVDLGDGGDTYIDAPGNDDVDTGPGPDSVYGGDFSTGDDTILGGEGDDNLDGRLGNDTIEAGTGNDIVQFGEGDDVMDGGDGDDYVAGDPQAAGNCGETGNDVLRGGAGADLICGGEGSHTIDGGPGPDAISSLDGAPDADVTCGEGSDVVWADVFDPVAVDCERQGQDQAVRLIGGRALRVPAPCSTNCDGTLSLFAARGVPDPEPGAFPSRQRPKLVGKALARQRFERRAGRRASVNVRLSKRAARRFRKLAPKTLEARTTLSFGGLPYEVRRTFPVRR